MRTSVAGSPSTCCAAASTGSIRGGRSCCPAGWRRPTSRCFWRATAAPDIIGINHYLTSERYLDEALHRYPESHWGGNGRQRYADAEAVRLPIPHEDLGPAARLREVWQRYRVPVAVTEVHHGCSRDDQLRWLAEVWKAAATVRAEGADIRAVTVWSLFGTVDWNSLLTRREGCYEPGAFDVRGPAPRPTILAAAARRLAKGEPFDHPVLDRAGWWKRQERFYRHVHRGPATCRLVGSPRELLIVGGRGTLGRAFSRICNARGLDHSLVGRAEMDIADPARVAAALDRARPWAVINAAGFVRPPRPDEEERCMRENAQRRARAGAGLRGARHPLADLLLGSRLRRNEGRPLRGG